MNNFKRRFVAGAAIASLATGAMAGAANATTTAAPESAGNAQASTQAQHKFQYISQVQGQASQYNDCGPASILMALLQNDGKLPSKYSDSDQSAAMTQIREEAGRGNSEFLQSDDVATILSNHGVKGTAHVNANATDAIASIKDGKQAIVLTQTGVISGEDAAPGYGHFVYVSGYNKDKGTFTVNDPLKTSKKSYQATETQLTNIITQAAEGNTPWTYTV
ncbi:MULTISPECIES: C39 family peptidase [Micrococcaceae]|uniref:C39 family peptidase n=1 Tax=unclassified Kocuria TaxID=2649579 RepID=UPI00101070F7|nr:MULTISPECIES: C39 family peptidase [unclassified Kocuria]